MLVLPSPPRRVLGWGGSPEAGGGGERGQNWPPRGPPRAFQAVAHALTFPPPATTVLSTRPECARPPALPGLAPLPCPPRARAPLSFLLQGFDEGRAGAVWAPSSRQPCFSPADRKPGGVRALGWLRLGRWGRRAGRCRRRGEQRARAQPVPGKGECRRPEGSGGFWK